jgi:predicted phage terminase large subunit-like protein
VFELPAIETMDRRIALPDGRTWKRTKGAVLLPDHMGKEELDRIRAEIGSARFEAQFQQSPVPAGGNIIKPEWFETIPGGLSRQDYEAIVQSWDVAAVPGESNDYSVCTTWGLIGNHIDLLDVYRAQHDPPQLLRAARKLRSDYEPSLLVIEAQGVGRSLYSYLRQDNRRGVRYLTPNTSKVERMSNETYALERGEVRLPEKAPWKEAFLAEVTAFPNGKYDDQVDSMSQALYAIRGRHAELKHCSRYKG